MKPAAMVYLIWALISGVLTTSTAFATQPLLTARLTGLDSAAGDKFGESVAVSGSTIVIGADDDDTFGTLAGAVYVYERIGPNGLDWEQTHQLVGSDTLTKDRFGSGVAIDGDVMVVGAQGVDGLINASGAAYIFERDGNGDWIQVKKLLPEVEYFFTYYGDAVAVSGDTVVVGAASGEDDFTGNVSIYQRNQGGADNWGLVTQLTGDGTGNFFGIAVAIDGDYLIVGASNFTGAVYFFERDEGGADNWGRVAKRVGPPQAGIGEAVDLAGELAIAGTFSNNSAYVFGRDQDGPGQWGLVKALLLPGTNANDRFGHAVAIGGGVAVVGNELDDDRKSNGGSLTFYAQDEGGTDNWGLIETVFPPDLAPEDRLGNELAMSGEFAVAGAAKGNAAFVYEQKEPSVDFQLGGDCPDLITLAVEGLTPNGAFRIYWSDSVGSFTIPNGGACAGLELGLDNPIAVVNRNSDDRGRVSRSLRLNPVFCGSKLQVVDAYICAASAVQTIPLQVE